MRRNMQIIFQDPYSSLDPRMPIGAIGRRRAAHPQDRHTRGTPAPWSWRRCARSGLEPYHARRYPHEFSGGQRQRIGIARALALQPKFIVADEPVSALDVSIQSQVLNILKDLQDEFHLTYLFIAHNLSVVEHISDRVAVMYLGKIVELAAAEDLFRNPLHPYTQALMSAIPMPEPAAAAQADPPERRRPQPAQSADGLPLPSALPGGACPHCAVQEPPLSRGQPRPLGGLLAG